MSALVLFVFYAAASGGCKKHPVATPDMARVLVPVEAPEPLPIARRVVGEVRASGKAEPFVTVKLGTAGKVRSVVSDEEGHFELADVAPGAYAIAATAHGLAAYSGVDVGVDPQQGRTVEVVLALEPATTLGGVVRDATGKPLAGAIVRIEEQERPLPVEAETKLDGRFSFDDRIVGRSYRVTVRRAGFLPDGPRLARAGGPPLDVRLHAGVSLDGLVVDEQGTPIAGAEVAVVSGDGDVDSAPLPIASNDASSGWSRLEPFGELGVLTGRIPFPPLTPLPPSALPSLSAPHTDKLGAFHLTELPAGRVIVTARHPDFAGAASVPVTLVGGVTGKVRIELARGARILGRIVDDKGLGLADAQITTSDGRTVLSDSSGRFSIEHVTGKVVLSVRRAGFLRGQGSVDIGTGQREASLDVTMRRALGRLGGDVTDASGRGVAGARLSISVGGESQSAITDSSGRFLVEGMADGPYKVTIEHADFARVVLPGVEATTDAHLVLRMGGGIDGELYDPRTGRAPSDAKLEWSQGDDHRALSLDGRAFRATGLPVGPCKLVATAHGYPRLVRTLEITEASRPGEITTRDVHLEMELGGQVRGRVRDDHGDPVTAVEVRVSSPPDATAPARTDSDGRFELDGVPVGSIKLVVRRGEDRLVEETVEVRSNEESRIELVAPAQR